MKQVRKQIVFILVPLGIIFVSLFSGTVSSYSNETTENPMDGFYFDVIYPENQQDKEKGYYDLLMSPGQKQTIELKLTNVSSKEKEIRIQLSSAKTNRYGVIEYGPSPLKSDTSLIHEFSTIVKGPERVTISPQSSQIVEFVIELPQTPFDGYIAGGIQLTPVLESQKEVETNNDVVENTFAYLIGVLISESETSELKPELHLNDIYPTYEEGIKNLIINFSNVRGVYVEGMTVEVQVRKKNKSKVLFEVKREGMRMAPNSMIAFEVPLIDKQLVTGDYTVHTYVKTSAGEWTWTKDIKLTGKSKGPALFEIPEKQHHINFWWWIVCFIVIVSFLFVIKRISHKLKVNVEGKERNDEV